MRRKTPPLWVSLLILVVALCWRMIGAPITAEEFHNLQTPLWQARIQLPVRLARIWRLWQPTVKQEAHTDESAPSETSDENPKIMVYITQENRLAEMTLEGYVCGVVAAEMPARYHLEALKAQAVAARTRVLQQRESGGCRLHPGADVCTDSAHCQAYAALAECQERWGNSYEAYRDRVLQAQQETRGEVLTYEGELITVLYHAMSGGRTEDAAMVFAEALPYLVSVESKGEEEQNGFWQETQISYETLVQKLAPLVQETLTPQGVRQTLSIASYTESGRVKAVRVGGEEIDAVDFRHAVGLRSTWFSITLDENGVAFLQRGYGHGVGMSQAGANSMAASGENYQGILAHYYPGTLLEIP